MRVFRELRVVTGTASCVIASYRTVARLCVKSASRALSAIYSTASRRIRVLHAHRSCMHTRSLSMPPHISCPPTPDRLRIACVGDSLTRGDGLHEHPPNHRVPAIQLTARQRPLRERGSYPAFLARLIGRRADVRNFGHGGSTACNRSGGSGPPFVGVHEMPAALQFSPHVVVLMLGTNDAKRHLWLSGPCSEPGHGIRAGLQQIVRRHH